MGLGLMCDPMESSKGAALSVPRALSGKCALQQLGVMEDEKCDPMASPSPLHCYQCLANGSVVCQHVPRQPRLIGVLKLPGPTATKRKQ